MDSYLTDRCLSCEHCGNLEQSASSERRTKVCLYILHEARRRGCPVGDECDKYEPKKETKRRVFNLL